MAERTEWPASRHGISSLDLLPSPMPVLSLVLVPSPGPVGQSGLSQTIRSLSALSLGASGRPRLSLRLWSLRGRAGRPSGRPPRCRHGGRPVLGRPASSGLASLSRIKAGRVGQEQVRQKLGCAAWLGWRSRPSSLGPERRQRSRERERPRAGRCTRPDGSRNVAAGRPPRMSPAAVSSNPGIGRRRPRGTASRLAGSGCDRTYGRVRPGGFGPRVIFERIVRRPLDRPTGPLPAGCRRRAQTGL